MNKVKLLVAKYWTNIIVLMWAVWITSSIIEIDKNVSNAESEASYAYSEASDISSKIDDLSSDVSDVSSDLPPIAIPFLSSEIRLQG